MCNESNDKHRVHVLGGIWSTRDGKWVHVCQMCNKEFYTVKRTGVKFCSATCRKRSSNGHKEWNTACMCKQCGGLFFCKQPFQHPEYCSNACKQKAYRARKENR